MVSLRGRLFYQAMKLFFRRLMPPEMSFQTYRKASNQPLFEPMPRGIRWKEAVIGGVVGDWITPPKANPAHVLLYLHGGGYIVKTPHVHRVLVGRLARAAETNAFIPDYRLAPEHPFPAALEDAAAAYRGLISQGYTPDHIVIAGDSSGGGLTTALLLYLRDNGDPLPAAACLISAMLDCTFIDPSLIELQQHDPFMRLSDVAMMARHYYGEHDPRNPLISPIFGDLGGMPPLLIHAGEYEILRAEAIRYAEKAQAAGVYVKLKVWEGMIHAFQLFAGFVPEGKTALKEIGAFFRSHLR